MGRDSALLGREEGDIERLKIASSRSQ